MSGNSAGNSISGAISFENFAAVRRAGESLIENTQGEVVIDIRQIEHANTLAVGAMVAWFRYGAKRNTQVKFANVPDPLRKIIRVSGLTKILLQGE